MVAPEDTFAAVGASFASAPLDTLVGVRPAHWLVPHVCVMVPVELVAASPRAGLPLRCRLDASLAQHPRNVTDVAPGSRCVSHRAVLWLIWAGRCSPTS